MSPPDEKTGKIGAALFEWHELFGVAAFTIILLHWLWSLFNSSDSGCAHLFPLNAKARKQVIDEFQRLRRLRLPEGGTRGGLPGLVHGLGLLTATGMVITGMILFFTTPEGGANIPATVELFTELHEALGGLMWAYVIAHVTMALAHNFAGHDNLRKMFSFTNH